MASPRAHPMRPIIPVIAIYFEYPIQANLAHVHITMRWIIWNS